MKRTLTTPVDNALYEALRDFCGPDLAVGAVDAVTRVLFQYDRASVKHRNPDGYLVLPVDVLDEVEVPVRVA